MCLAIPGKVLDIADDPFGVRMGRANFGGIVKAVCLQYTPDVQPGDYVLVHVGFALGKVDEAEAERTYRILEELEQLGELDAPEFDDDGERVGTRDTSRGAIPAAPFHTETSQPSP
jgi:hydrogenase expression/formation protein HypC